MFQKFQRLSVTKKVSGGLLACAVLAILAGSSQPSQPKSMPLNAQTDSSSGQIQGDSTANTPSAPQITTKTITETQAVPRQFITQNDANLPKGQNEVITQGVNGVETLTYKITYANGQRANKQLINKTITKEPVAQVTAVGAYVAPTPQPAPKSPPASCHPLTNGGNCYEPGEYCRNSDHGLTGIAGDGKNIICADNDGWRWEPR